MYRVRAILALLLFLSSASLWAQSDDATLTNITNLEQLHAIRYDLNGDGMVDASASMADSISYETAFSLARKGSITCTGGCSGYELMNDLDFAGTKWENPTGGTFAGTHETGGWALIGYFNSSTDNASYTATFDGNDYTISNLYINRPSTNYVGLFGLLGTGGNVRNLGIEGGSVSGNNRVGGLVGRNLGTISTCYATGNASGSSSLRPSRVGGLVGRNDGTIRACYATGNATGTGDNVGGLVGQNTGGTMSACYATGNATGTGTNVGGLVGQNVSGTIRACYATGNASGSFFVGGLVGFNVSGTISACYATGDAGNARGTNQVGGLVGNNTGTISACYATGNATVTGSTVGGLVGNNTGGTITNSYFDSSVSNRPAADSYSKTTAQLQTPAAYGTGADIYANWNLDLDGDSNNDDPWDFGTDSEYPALKVDFNVDGAPSAAEFGMQPRTASLRVSSFTPTSGAVGATVTIRGKLFSTTAADNTVTFLGAEGDDTDNVEATVSTSPAPTAASLTVTAPPDAQTGPISVMVGTAADTSSQDFTVLIGEDKDENDNGLIEVSSLEQLDAIHYDLDGDGIPSGTDLEQTAYRTAFGVSGAATVVSCTGGCVGYELMNNLDFEDADGDGTADDKSIWAEGASGAGVSGAVAEGWAPIGYWNSFTDRAYYTATFDGRGRTISNLYINRPSTGYVGLFGVLGRGGNLRNLGIEGGSLSGDAYVGGLVGRNFGTISACYATVNVTASKNDVGGLVGSNFGTISACYATGNASGSGFVGGLLGYNFGTISACYATGDATGTGSDVGGLVGINELGTISACYATGNATGNGTNVGGLMGSNSGTVTNSYFDSSVSNRPAADSYSKTTAQLQTSAAYGTAMDIYANWNIDVDDGLAVGVDDATMAGDDTADYPWDFGADSEYPVLSVDFNVDGTPSAAEFGMQRHTASLGVFIFTPERGVVGATVTIRGRLFSTTATDNIVTFLGAEGDADNAAATVSTSPAPTAASLTVTVPPAAKTGPISVMVGAAADTSSQDFTVVIGEDKDANDNGLIEVSSLEQLDAIRYDLDGDGIPSGTDLEQAAYRTAFGLSGAGTSASCTGGCEGYELMNNLDFEDANGNGTSDDKSIWAGASVAGVSGAVAEGWVPIGDNSNTYTATFDGRDHTISNLYINRSSTNYVGLFGALGTGGNVRNLGIEGGSLSGNNRVGGLVGVNNGGTISDCHATVNVTASKNGVGGLVGMNEGGTITNSHATGTVTGSGLSAGGLVGWNNGGAISACYAMGNVTGTGNTVGGLVGANEGGEIRASYATGTVTGTANNVGGLVGWNQGTISVCYATGDATGTGDYVGGLVGNNAATISACYATGNASGSSSVGGLMGYNRATISACYVTGNATGTGSDVGGLVGSNSGTVTNSYFDSDVSNRPDTDSYAKTTTELQTPTAYDDNIDATDGSSIYETWNIDVDDGQPIGVDDGTMAGDDTADDPWDFETATQYPALRVDFDGSSTATAAEFGMQPRTASLRISSFTPERGVVGATVTITGAGFSTTAGDNAVTFLGAATGDADDVVATVSAATTTLLTVTVPPDVQTGPISVMVGAAADISSQDFRVLIFPPDTDADGLIDITTLAQLDAIRYDLDGDGRPTSAGQTAWQTAFSAVVTVDDDAAVHDGSSSFTGYELRNNLDFEDANGDGTADDKSIWAEGASTAGVSGAVAEGWVPIGDNSTSSDESRFTATFDGRGHTISNLYINRPSTDNVGLFGALWAGSNVRNLGIEGGSLTGAGLIGGLVGRNGGTISACYATGNASGSYSVGGLVGFNGGTISACYATGNASGSRSVGGLVGESFGTISACYATGDATGTGDLVGGLVGFNGGTISACYATGNASGSSNVGGLVGQNTATISACYATGNASGSSDVGGLVGSNFGGATVTNSYFDSDVSNRTDSDDYAKTTTDLQTPTAYGTGTDIYANWNIDVDDGLAVGVDDGTMPGDAAADDPWDFGTDSEYPALRVDFNVNGTPTAFEFGGQGRAVPATVPDALAALTATAADAEVTLSWTAAASDGAPITGYMIEYSVSADFSSPTTVSTAAAATSYTVSGLTNGTLYYFRIAAVNAAGTAAYYPGAADDAVSATPATVPSPPSALTAMAADAEVTLSWTAAASDGGAPITGYMVEYDTDMNFPSPTPATTAAAATSHTVSGLTNGTLYYFRVAAVNAVGTGAYYPGASGTAATPAPATPAAPPVVSSFTPTSGAVDTEVKIWGTSFSSTATEDSISFGGSTYVVASSFIADTRAGLSPTVDTLVVSVPSDAQTGKISVKVLDGVPAMSTVDFTVTVPAPDLPVVSSFTPTSGAVGETVMITGTGFSATATDNTVVFLGAEGDDADNAEATVSAATATSLTVSVPPAAQTGKISVMIGTAADTSDASFTVTGTTPAAPVVSSFSPTEDVVGTSVTITGDNFSATASENEVRFGGVMAAAPTSASTTSLTVLVPSGAVTGSISVAVGGQTGTSSTDFTVEVPAPAAPVVSSFSPTEGVVGTSVTITGENFSETPSENEVRFGGVMAAAPTSASTTSLTILVPSVARTGSISVAVGGQAGTSEETFTVTVPASDPPVVSSFSPTEGAVDQEVTVMGENFSETPSENEVRFGGKLAAAPTSATTTSLVVLVPSGAVTGSISVAVGGQTGTSEETFTVPGTMPASEPPVISGFSPVRGAPGTSVKITGQNFSETPSENDVRFGGVMADEPTSASTTSLTVRVPSGARPGPGRIFVTVGDQTATSKIVFTVPVRSISITNIRPVTAAVGNTITISGLGFSITATENEVYL